MSKLLDELLDFLSSATHEQLEENWKSLEPYEKIGPSAREFVEYSMRGFQFSLHNDVNNFIFVNNEKIQSIALDFFIYQV